jgi:methanogenic corrinoid protein MtbC1/DNA-binding XRE family transcriptional regulator
VLIPHLLHSGGSKPTVSGDAVPSEIIAKVRDAYCAAVLDGNADAAVRAIDQGLASGIIPSKLYLDVLMRVQVELGARWHRGEVTIPQEHIATQITLRQMARLRSMLKTRLKLGLKAVVSSVEGDQHFVGAQAVADFLVVDGWEVDFLGADVPTDHLVPFVKARGAHLVCVSVSLDSLMPTAAHLIQELRKIPVPPKILLGGASIVLNPALAKEAGADEITGDPHQAVTLARHLCGLLNSENALALFLRKLGQSVHEYRKLRGMSQQELATSSDLDRAYISAVEHGKQNISIGAIAKLAKALQVSIEELLIGAEY